MKVVRPRFPYRILGPLLWTTLPILSGCATFHGQQYRDFSATTPLSERSVLVLGFLGGRERWDNPRDSVRQLALELRTGNLPVVVETVENEKRELALRLIQNAFDRDGNGSLDVSEVRRVRLIIYGQSFGGAAVVKLSRQLYRRGIPVLLTVQIDSVGLGDRRIPPNVRRAANLFQSNGWIIRGEPEIVAEDPEKTEILGNFQYDYRDGKIDISEVSFWKKIFRKAHVRMARDPDVWDRVESLIRSAVLEAFDGPLTDGN